VDLNSERHAMMDLMRVQSGNIGFDYRIFDRAELSDMLPGLGPAVSGAAWTPMMDTPTLPRPAKYICRKRGPLFFE